MSRPVLARQTKTNTVMERRFEPVEIGPQDVHSFLGNQPRQALTNALTHDPGLAVIHDKPLFGNNGGDVSRKSLGGVKVSSYRLVLWRRSSIHEICQPIRCQSPD